jgi:mannosyltransferase OCH1-like enzyme
MSNFLFKTIPVKQVVSQVPPTQSAPPRNKEDDEKKIPESVSPPHRFPLKSHYNSIIPLNIFQTWHTKKLTPKMHSAITLIKNNNPKFKHYLYDEDDCRKFIKTNFHEEVLCAYDSLVPAAYKADLWRYCILYKAGGIYVDVRYLPYNGFKFINLTEKEHFVLDLPSCNTHISGIYNALMVCLPGNKVLIKAINQIVENVAKKHYGSCWLEPTGPLLLEKYVSDEEKLRLELRHYTSYLSLDDKMIKYNDYVILEGYDGYSAERESCSAKQHYADLWKQKQIYKSDSEDNEIPFIIPLHIYQTWYTKDLPTLMSSSVAKLKAQNPEFEHHLYDDNDCREFIKENFHEEVLNAYDSLVPGAYKADLWRLCILFINGGIYMDIKFSCVEGFKLIELARDEHFVLDRQNHFNTPNPIYNGLMVSKKDNPFLLLGIRRIVLNVKNKYYGFNTLYPTGPGMLSEVLLKNNNLIINTDLKFHDDGKHIEHKKRLVILMYDEYRQEQEKCFVSTNTKHYHNLWYDKNIYI